MKQYFREDIKREIPVFEESDLLALKELRIGMVFSYRGYEITIAEPRTEDTTPAFFTLDALSNKWVIFVNEDVPIKLLIPVLEHEICELGHNHEKAVEVGRKKAEELGALGDFIEFENKWHDKI